MFVLLRSTPFIRALQKIIKKNPEMAKNIQNTLELLSVDPFHSRLKTHKLKGEFQYSWSCSVAYDLRIIFQFVEYEGKQAILLESIGTHDQVY